MKKRKITFSIFNYFDETQKEIVKLQNGFKAVSVVVTGSTYFATDNQNTLIVLVGLALVNELFCFLKIEEIEK